MIMSFMTKYPNGVQTDFVHKIMFGYKIHTVREDTNRRWEKGQKIHFATGVRTKNYNCFKTAVCTGIQEVRMYQDHREYPLMLIDDRVIAVDECAKFLRLDGIENFNWFFRNGEKFVGRIIHWTEFRY